MDLEADLVADLVDDLDGDTGCVGRFRDRGTPG
jgi:hypothetical protein